MSDVADLRSELLDRIDRALAVCASEQEQESHQGGEPWFAFTALPIALRALRAEVEMHDWTDDPSSVSVDGVDIYDCIACQDCRRDDEPVGPCRYLRDTAAALEEL